MSEYSESMNDHNRRDGRDAIDRLASVNFADALGETSVRTRRALLGLSIIACILAKYSINVKEIPWLEIPAPVDATGVVPMLLLAALIYHWLSFLFYGLADAIKWETTRDASVFGARSQMIYRLDEHIRRFEDAASKMAPESDLRKWMEVQRPAAAEARAVCDSAIAEWNSFYSISKRGFWLKRLTVWTWEITLPLVFGFVAAVWLFMERLYR
jgi:hypothetical protein